MSKKIGIIGGSFDPIHLGHLIIAQEALEQFALDTVIFLPARQAPLKSKQSQADAVDRLAMTRLAVADNDRFTLSTLDIEAEGTSYSIHSARKLREQHPDAELYWIIGADQVEQLHHWRDIDALATHVSFVAFQRPGCKTELPQLPESVRVEFARSRIVEISSTEIRERIKNQREVKYFLPDPVLTYIKSHSLYR